MPHTKLRRKRGLFSALMLQTLFWQDGKRTLRTWTRMFKPAWEAIAMDEGLNRTELRLLLLCSVNLGPANRIMISQHDMAYGLSLSPSAINKALQVLVRGGLVLRSGQTFSINSRLVAEQPIREVADLRREEIAKLRHLDPSFKDTAFPKE